MNFEKIKINFPKHLENLKDKFLNEENNKKFFNYIKTLPEDVNEINIRDIFMFGSEKIGFINIDFNYKGQNKFVFLRGNAVAILPIIKSENKKYILMCSEYRTGSNSTFLGIPAGMMDNDECFHSVALKELEEETSIKIKKENLQFICESYPSVGGCDEVITLFRCEIELDESELKKIEQKIHGNKEENENIKVNFYEYNSFNIQKLMTSTKDMKSILALQNEIIFHFTNFYTCGF